MFDMAELGQKVEKKEYKERIESLRLELVNAQYELREADFPLVIVLDGDDVAACGDVLLAMHEWMDGRYLETHVYGDPSEAQRERPPFWRYWSELPRKGRAGVFVLGWALEGIRRRVLDRFDDVEFERWIAHVRRFEKALVDDGALLVKLWFHAPKKELKRRLKWADKNPEEAWRVPRETQRIYQAWDRAIPVAERLVKETSTSEAPWTVIESGDLRFAGLRAAETIHTGLRRRLDAAKDEPPHVRDPDLDPIDLGEKSLLGTVDLTRSLDKDEYRERLTELQSDLARLTVKAQKKGLASVLGFEGWDAAGKGGVIRRLTAAMDPRTLRLVPVGAPTEEEAAHHYLWRFWQHVPKAGRTTLFDRTWYGRVLVERLEGFASASEWKRAFGEINDFESQLAEFGIVVLKFWLHIDPEEQLRRFQAREQTPYKQHKITEEDYRNRERWDDYVRAVDEMVGRTHSNEAPWHLVSANDKRWARCRVLEITCDALKQRL